MPLVEGKAVSVADCCHISAAAFTSPSQGQEIEPEAGVLCLPAPFSVAAVKLCGAWANLLGCLAEL